MLPDVIIHNTVSLDSAILGFEIDLGLHYATLLAFEPDAILAGSATARYGIDMFLDEVPAEEEGDRIRPVPAPPPPNRPRSLPQPNPPSNPPSNPHLRLRLPRPCRRR